MPRKLLALSSFAIAGLLVAAATAQQPIPRKRITPDRTIRPGQPTRPDPRPRRPGRGDYVPSRFDWQRRAPARMGFDPQQLQQAIAYAKRHFNPRGGFDPAREPYPEVIGPTRPPSGMNGMVVRRGYIVAEWGDTHAVDMTFSITKTYLSTVAGLAVDAGRIHSVDDPVRLYHPDGYTGSHNQPITWHQLLNQTSGWEGTLWGKPDWSDRYRGRRRPSERPGEHWRYNDVRVNQLAHSLLQVWRRPLPQVLRRRIMDPIGASCTWRWHGYRNSWVNIDGQRMQSVSGGGHWGGGMFISTRDQARFGLLMLRGGVWGERRLLSRRWIARARTPTPQNPKYGYMNWFLNTAQAKQFPAASVGSVFFLGAGSNVVWLDPDHDMVVVVRWIQRRRVNGFLEQVLRALRR